jgi:hypothetical protein
MRICKEGENGMGWHLLGMKVQQKKKKKTGNQHYH